MKAASMKPNAGAVVLTESKLPTGIVFKNKHMLYNVNSWHKFIVNNPDNAPRSELLEAILDHVHPLDLIPVSYWTDENNANFLARNCGPAIEKLCKDNLVVANPKSPRPYKLTIVLKFVTTGEFKIDVQKNILTVLSRRYDAITKILDLSRFYVDTDLVEYCSLSQPKIMFFVLHLAKTLMPTPEKYVLSDNKIKLLNPLESLSSQVNSIKYLDLRNNLIPDIEALEHINMFKLQELYLDGNPLCENMTQGEYITSITRQIKGLAILDGIPLKKGTFPMNRRNYVCDFRAQNVINQFLERYFYHYDSQDRSSLKDIYHTNAMFSLNCTYHSGQLSSAHTRLHHYNNVSRNINKLANLALFHKNLYQGNIQIVNILSSLPPTEHDPYSFIIDGLIYMNNCVVFGVSGVFRERAETLLQTERTYGFHRTFVLLIKENGLCHISNEQVHVYNAMSRQVVDAFKVIKPPVTENVGFPQNEEEQLEVIEALKKITTMNTEWATKCLEECNYNLKKTLTLFVDLYKQNKIPEEGLSAFPKNKKRKF